MVHVCSWLMEGDKHGKKTKAKTLNPIITKSFTSNLQIFNYIFLKFQVNWMKTVAGILIKNTQISLMVRGALSHGGAPRH